MTIAETRPGILIVDDERDLAALLAFLAEQAGLAPLVAYEPMSALTIIDQADPAIALVDLNLTPWDGFELVAELRRRRPGLPIVVLTGRNTEDDKVRALDLGADDYVVKPFGHRELVARIRAHVRRASTEQHVPAVDPVLQVGPLRLDTEHRSLELDDETLHLTGTEFRLLQQLMRNANSVVPTGTLAKHIWGYDDPPARDAVRVTVHRLRRKLGDNGAAPRFIHTVPGVGLKLRLN